jgi:general secretion pathway protein G
MKNRKRGFSLVELLIVLAVIAALIATITPVALNAIKKAKATQVAQNLKTIASAIENKAYVDGLNDDGLVFENTEDGFKEIARDIDVTKYAVYYKVTDGKVNAIVTYVGDVDDTELKKVLPNVERETDDDDFAFAIDPAYDAYAKLYAADAYENGYYLNDDYVTAIKNGPVSYYEFEFTVY